MRTRLPRTVLCNRCQYAFEPRELSSYPYANIRGPGAPSEVEMVQLLNMIKEEEAEVERYDEELGRLRGIAERLESEKTALQESISGKRGLLSASRRIPPEVWDIIFGEVVVSGAGYSYHSSTGYSFRLHYEHPEDDEDEDEATEPHPGQVEAPTYVLSQVSSHWRRLVHSMPHLWSSISVDLYGLKVDICPILELYFRNSGEYPLTFEILDTQWISKDPENEMMGLTEKGCEHEMFARRALAKLASRMDRCKQIQLSLDGNESIFRFDHPLPLSFPILQRFSYRKFSDEAVESVWLLDRILHAAKELKDVTINDLRNFGMIPVTQLTSLRINFSMGLRPLLDALTTCTQLESLTIDGFKVGSEEAILVPVELFSIRSLSIASDPANQPEALNTLFSVLTVPSLIILTLTSACHEWQEQHPDWPWQALYDMLRRSSCPLQELFLNTQADYMSGHQELVRILCLFPQSLKYLEIKIHHTLSSTIDVLFNLLDALTFPTSSSEHALLLPKLGAFSLWIISVPEHPKLKLAKKVLYMGESRTKHRTQQMSGRVSSLSSLSFVIYKNQYALRKEAKARVPPFVPPFKQIRQLTATGMACTVEERIEHVWKRQEVV